MLPNLHILDDLFLESLRPAIACISARRYTVSSISWIMNLQWESRVLPATANCRPKENPVQQVDASWPNFEPGYPVFPISKIPESTIHDPNFRDIFQYALKIAWATLPAIATYIPKCGAAISGSRDETDQTFDTTMKSWQEFLSLSQNRL